MRKCVRFADILYNVGVGSFRERARYERAPRNNFRYAVERGILITATNRSQNTNVEIVRYSYYVR